jgi:hypothetical protein
MQFFEFDFVRPAIQIIMTMIAQNPTCNCSVVFDIDDTLLYDIFQPIVPLRNLYKFFLHYKIPIYFITARSFNPLNLKSTCEHLTRAGYFYYDGLFLMPTKNIVQFKTSIRHWLNNIKKANIKFIIGNTWHDLFEPQELTQNILKLNINKTYLILTSNAVLLKLPQKYNQHFYS